MNKIFTTFLVLVFSAGLLRGQVQIQWQKCLGGTEDEESYSIIQTTDGGYAFTGYTKSNDGDVSGNHGGMYDAWVVKLNHIGNVQWKKCLGGSYSDYIWSISQTVNGGYILAGASNSNDGDVNGNHGDYDVWIVNLDSLGNVLWQKCLGGTNGEHAYSIIQTNDSGFVVAGTTASNDGDVSGNHGGYTDVWVVKLDTFGNIQWQKCLGGTDNESTFSIIQTADSGYVVACISDSDDGDINGNHGDYDAWIIKLDMLGNIQWSKCFGGTNLDYAMSVIETADGGYIFAGHTFSNDGDVSGHLGTGDVWIVKLSSQGFIQWQKCLGGSYYDIARSIIVADDNNYVIAGHTYSNDVNINGNNGGSDFWIVKIDYQGNLLWQKCLGGTNGDHAYSVCQTGDKGFVVAGNTSSNDIDVIGNHGENDFWVVKLIVENISGKVFHDINENGLLDSLEQGASGHLVKLEPGPHFTITNNEGMYYFAADSGNHTVSYVPYAYWYTTTDSSFSFSVDSVGHFIDTLHFGIKNRYNVNDVAVYVTGSPTRAGFPTHYWLTYKNWGTVTASGTVQFKYDSLLTYLSSSTVPASHTANVLVFDYDTLGPGAQRTIMVDFQVPGIQYLGDTLHSMALINPLVPDTNTLNNYDTIVQVIVASYDPNDKQVSPPGYGTPGYVLHGQRLTYTIRFQNTGTDTAFTVVLRDTLSPHLDISTILFEAWSHEPTYELHTGNELFIAFNNILLPDSNVNEPESHGFIRFSISPKPGLADNTEVTNTGYIFFDYNPAIVTNTTLNTYVSHIPLASPAIEKGKASLTLYPNPSSELIYINLPELTRKAELYDINGKLLTQITPQSPVLEINISGLQAGLYFVKLYTGSGIVNTKFVKE